MREGVKKKLRLKNISLQVLRMNNIECKIRLVPIEGRLLQTMPPIKISRAVHWKLEWVD